jgi:hypothetical protein
VCAHTRAGELKTGQKKTKKKTIPQVKKRCKLKIG